jgi:hypothetical protein
MEGVLAAVALVGGSAVEGVAAGLLTEAVAGLLGSLFSAWRL